MREPARFLFLSVSLMAMAVAGELNILSAQDQPKPVNVDRILVEKSKHTMTLFSGDVRVKTCWVALGGEPVGAKQREGDHKTPEGKYTIDSRNARSKFHLALHISYPNEADRKRARKRNVSPGGAIMIHGLPDEFAFLGALHRKTDWTDGCIAVTDEEIEEIWRLVKIGTPVEIKP
jgi:murein L,D-transpeptidase YafK